MPGRKYSAGSGYRYGFNGKEDDDETGWQDYGFRIYDSRLAKFFSVDPLADDYPYYSPYQFAGNMPIWFIDLDGGEPDPPEKKGSKPVTTVPTVLQVTPPPIPPSLFQNGPVANIPPVHTEASPISGNLAAGLYAKVCLFAPAQPEAPSIRPSKPQTPQQSQINQKRIQYENEGKGLDINGNPSQHWSYKFGRDKGVDRLLTTMNNASIVVGIPGLLKGGVRVIASSFVRNVTKGGFSMTKSGELTNGIYTVSQEAMKKHVFGGVSGKSIFYPTLNSNEAVLKAAQYADDAGLWIQNAGTKAKVPVINSNIGTTGLGQPTNIINVYRKPNGMIHGAPGN